MTMETFRILHNLSPPVYKILKIKEDSYIFRYSNILQISAVRTTTYGKKVYKYTV